MIFFFKTEDLNTHVTKLILESICNVFLQYLEWDEATATSVNNTWGRAGEKETLGKAFCLNKPLFFFNFTNNIKHILRKIYLSNFIFVPF